MPSDGGSFRLLAPPAAVVLVAALWTATPVAFGEEPPASEDTRTESQPAATAETTRRDSSGQLGGHVPRETVSADSSVSFPSDI